jgi:hypothetical protein
MALRKGIPAKLALTDADDTRYDFRNLVVCNSDGTPRGGVTSPVGVNLLSSTATMNVAVAAFNAVAGRDSGAILLANDGPVNVTLTSAPASNSRIDVIYAKQNDGSSTVTSPDANSNPIIDKVTGTASATPVKPSIPTGAVELGTVVVPAGATATNSAGVVITTTCPFTAAPGGKVPFRTLSDLQAWTTAMPGQAAHVISDTTTANLGHYNLVGSSWLKNTGALLLPSSVSGGTLNADGSITVSGSRINIDGLLTHARAVRIEGVVSTASNQIIYSRLRSSGSDVTANHAEQFHYSAAGTGGGTPNGIQNPNIGNTGWQIGAISAVWQKLKIELFQGGQAAPTIGRCDVDSYASLTGMGNSSASVFQADSSARDGIGISAGSVTGTTTMSGTLWCYAIA